MRYSQNAVIRCCLAPAEKVGEDFLLELNELIAFWFEIYDDIALVGANFIPDLDEQGGFAREPFRPTTRLDFPSNGPLKLIRFSDRRGQVSAFRFSARGSPMLSASSKVWVSIPGRGLGLAGVLGDKEGRIPLMASAIMVRCLERGDFILDVEGSLKSTWTKEQCGLAHALRKSRYKHTADIVSLGSINGRVLKRQNYTPTLRIPAGPCRRMPTCGGRRHR